MELTLKKQGVDCFDEIVCETIRREETLDSVVPDTMPDISEIVSSSGLVLIRSKDASEGKIRLEANVSAKVLYTPEGGGAVQCISVSIPVSICLENDEIDSYCKCCARLILLSVEARMLNPRKVLVKAELAATISCHKPGRMELCAAPEEHSTSINLLEKKTYITPAVCVSEKSFVITDEHQLAASKPTASEIVGTRVNMSVEETKTVGSKIIVKGSAKTQILYNCSDGVLCAAEFVTGFSQIIETEIISQEPFIDISLMLSGSYVEIMSDSGGRMVSIELHALAQYVTSERRMVSYLADAYSNTHELEMVPKTLETQVTERTISASETLHETIETPNPVATLVDFSASAGVAVVSGDKIVVPVTLCLIYMGSDGVLRSHRKRVETNVETGGDATGTIIAQSASCGNAYATQSSGMVELRVSIEVRAAVCVQKEIGFISEISSGDAEVAQTLTRPSMVLKKASSGDDLWSIAKQCGSTVSAIIDANRLEELETWEKYILIPKVN